MEAKSYTPWLLRKSERDFFGLCLNYSDNILNHTELLKEEVEHYLNEHWGKREGIHGLLIKKSQELRKTHKQLIRRLAEIEVIPEHRGNLSRILFGLRDVSAYIDSTSHRMELKDISLSPKLKKKIRTMMDKTVKIVVKLHETVELMNKDLERVIENTTDISRLEDEIDTLRRGMMKDIVSDPDCCTMPDFFVVAETLNSMETVSDKVEKVSNNLEIIATSHLP